MADRTPAPPGDARAARAARAGAASAIAVVVALAAHLAGGGAAPPLIVLVAAAVLVQPVAVLLAGRRPRLWRQAAVIGVAQAAMHLVFMLGSGVRTPVAVETPVMPGMPGMSGGSAGIVDEPAPVVHAMPGMAAWHVVAWAVTVLAWRWGEAAVGRLLRVVRRAVRRRTAPLLPLLNVPVPLAPPAPSTAPVLLAADPRRGPPVRS